MKNLDPESLRSGPTNKSLIVRPVCAPMVPPRTSSGEVMESPLVQTDIVLDSGVDQSVIFTYTRATLKPTAVLLWNMEPRLASVVRTIGNGPNS